MSKFKVGDKVRIKYTSRFYDRSVCNPSDCSGKIISILNGTIFGLGIRVNWDNNTFNDYNESDLELVEEQMTYSYNEENVWYGWNGGVCPVHPETWIQVIEMQISYGPVKTQGLAKWFNWSDKPTKAYGNIIAFRITKLHEEKPGKVTMWGVTHGNDLVFYSPEKENCEQYVRNRDWTHKIIKLTQEEDS